MSYFVPIEMSFCFLREKLGATSNLLIKPKNVELPAKIAISYNTRQFKKRILK